MQHEFTSAVNHGQIVKTQSFETDKGKYDIHLIRWNDNVYFVKYQNGKIVECCNLNKMKAMKENGNK